ncbi:MAG: hypothetical protein LBD27_07255 [Tannerella sp.]|nr:hypothetical protein [Tannerella sp.]
MDSGFAGTQSLASLQSQIRRVNVVETLHATSLQTQTPLRAGNPLGLPRSVEGLRPFQPASRSGCNPNGMQGRVWGCVSTERRIPTGCRLALANDTRIVNPVETHGVRLSNATRRINAVETRCIASLHTSPTRARRAFAIAETLRATSLRGYRQLYGCYMRSFVIGYRRTLFRNS